MRRISEKGAMNTLWFANVVSFLRICDLGAATSTWPEGRKTPANANCIADKIALSRIQFTRYVLQNRGNSIQLKCLIFTNTAPKPQLLIHSGHVNFQIQNPKCTSILGLKTKSTNSEITSRASGVVETPAVSSILSLNPRGPQRQQILVKLTKRYIKIRIMWDISSFEIF